MARRELKIIEGKADTFSTRSYLLKHEAEGGLLEPDSLVRKMNAAHQARTSGKLKLKLRVSGPIREALEYARKVKIEHPTIKYRIMKNALDRKDKTSNFVSDSIRIYLEF